MKKLVKVEQSFCDFCGEEANGYSKCLCCGKDICYSCQKTQAVDYPHGVHVSGTGDGLYCVECDTKMGRTGDQLHSAYRYVQMLRDEYKRYHEDFSQRAKLAELHIEELLAIAKATAKGK